MKYVANFTRIGNEVIESGISVDALGMMLYLMSKPDNWVIRVTHIEKHFKIGRTKRRRIFAELRAAGFLRTVFNIDNEGGSLFILSDYKELPEGQVTDLPAQKAESQVSKGSSKPTPIVTTDNKKIVTTDISPPKKKRGRVCPEDWMPSETQVDALRKLHPSMDLNEALDEMKCHEYAKPKSHWNLAFQTWCKNKAKWSKDDGKITGEAPCQTVARTLGVDDYYFEGERKG
jgi:hypothetical protein